MKHPKIIKKIFAKKPVRGILKLNSGSRSRGTSEKARWRVGTGREETLLPLGSALRMTHAQARITRY